MATDGSVELNDTCALASEAPSLSRTVGTTRTVSFRASKENAAAGIGGGQVRHAPAERRAERIERDRGDGLILSQRVEMHGVARLAAQRPARPRAPSSPRRPTS